MPRTGLNKRCNYFCSFLFLFALITCSVLLKTGMSNQTKLDAVAYDSYVAKVIPTVSEGNYLITPKGHENLCLALENSEFGSNIILKHIDYSGEQKVKISFYQKAYNLKFVGATLALDVQNSEYSDGPRIQAALRSDSKGQLWQFIESSDGYWYIVSIDGAWALSFDDVGNSVSLTPFSYAVDQRWKLL